jgi:hypothetical protein
MMGAPDEIESISDSAGVSLTPLAQDTLEVDAVADTLGTFEFGIFAKIFLGQCPNENICDRKAREVVRWPGETDFANFRGP